MLGTLISWHSFSFSQVTNQHGTHSTIVLQYVHKCFTVLTTTTTATNNNKTNNNNDNGKQSDIDNIITLMETRSEAHGQQMDQHQQHLTD